MGDRTGFSKKFMSPWLVFRVSGLFLMLLAFLSLLLCHCSQVSSPTHRIGVKDCGLHCSDHISAGISRFLQLSIAAHGGTGKLCGNVDEVWAA